MITAVVVAAAVLAPVGAHAREPGTRFKARSKGAPVTTILGGWSRTDDRRHVELEVTGGHVVGDRTRFTAAWLTPWTRKGRQPRFEHTFVTSAMNPIGDDINLVERFRWRRRGGSWSGWVARSLPYRRGELVGWTGAGFFRGFKEGSMQFEWEVRGSFRGPAEFEGSWVLRTN